ncbi:Glucan endo-1,3-beta-glucosidase 8 [Ananas comosus]|uniref:Glucan endo-1,3-beta-glucosidase 8 n=1 Tax=Ananas comosus TaxID=4615 RepID=A0A199V2V7_ANACO|nr:Glucan endo-1,3-beta-glucosidase 8 [Ananas comosus]
MARALIAAWAATYIALVSSFGVGGGSGVGIGVNWGTMMSHPMHPATVAAMLHSNGIAKVKLFDADPWTVAALAGSPSSHARHPHTTARPRRRQLRPRPAVGQAQRLQSRPRRRRPHQVPFPLHPPLPFCNLGNDIACLINCRSGDCAENLLNQLLYVAVGNEPLLKSYNGSFTTTISPPQEHSESLDEAGVGRRIKADRPLTRRLQLPADDPSVFRKLSEATSAPSWSTSSASSTPAVLPSRLYQNPNFPVEFAFFDGGGKPVYDNGVEYTNVFDANFDTLVWSLQKAGVPDLKVIVGEVGWPTDGDKNANKIARKEGTPLRPGDMEVYIFALIDENQKSVQPGNFERHWGIFTYDGKPKFPMDLTGEGRDKILVGAARVKYLPSQWCVLNEDASNRYKNVPASVNYACSNADCTPLGYGSSCNGLSKKGNISYAFNMYFQMMDQDVRACDFGGLAKITTENASQGGCLFPIQILSAGERTASGAGSFRILLAVVMVVYTKAEERHEFFLYLCVREGKGSLQLSVAEDLDLGHENSSYGAKGSSVKQIPKNIDISRLLHIKPLTDVKVLRRKSSANIPCPYTNPVKE